MADILEMLEGLLQIPVEWIFISVGLGYFVFRTLKKKELKQYSDFDKAIFSSVTGILLYLLISNAIIKPILSFFGLIIFESISFIAGFLTVILFLFLLTLFSIDAIIGLKSFQISKKSFSQYICSKQLFYLIETLLLSFSYGALIIVISSVFSSFKAISIDLLKAWIGIFVVARSITLLQVLENSKNINISLSRISRKLHAFRFSRKIIYPLLLLSIMIFLSSNYIFPKITYGIEQTNAYVLDVGYSMNEVRHRQFFEHTVQPVGIKHAGMLGTIFIENNEKLIVNDSLRRFTPNHLDYGVGLIMDAPHSQTETGRIETEIIHEIIGNGITNISYNEKYGGYVIKFDNLDKYNLTNTYLSGYRKANMDSEDFVLYEKDETNESTVKIFAANRLNNDVVSYKKTELFDHNDYEGDCLIYPHFVEMYDLSTNKLLDTYVSVMPEGSKTFGVSYDCKDDPFFFQLENEVLFLHHLRIPAHTNISLSFIILCE